MQTQRPNAGDPAELRRRAEERLARRGAPPAELAGNPELGKLLAEQQVREIELEVQNEEMQRAQRELEVAKARYHNLYDQAPVAYFTLDEHGIIKDANQTAACLLGIPCAVLAGQALRRFVAPEELGVFDQKCRQLFAQSAPAACELRMQRADATVFWGQLEATVVRDIDDSPLCCAVLTDTSLRRRAEEELRGRATALEALNQAMLGREARIVALKDEVDRLQREVARGSQGAVSAAPVASPAEPVHRMPVAASARLRWLAGAVLLAALAVTAATWTFSQGETMRRARDRFDFRVERVQSELREHLLANEYLLRSGAGLFAASQEVTRLEWHTFVASLEIDNHYPGVQGLGFAARISPSARLAHEDQVRGEGFPTYSIHPVGERAEYTAIVYLEPFDRRNQRAFGYDMFTEAVRRDAMVRARDTGEVALSGKVTLLQETEQDKQVGFLMYVPVYRHGVALATVEQRREALLGYVYSPFRMQDFLRSVLHIDSWGVELQIFDGAETAPAALLHVDGAVGRFADHQHQHLFSTQADFTFGDHHWQLALASTPAFEAAIIEQRSLTLLLLLGVLVSLLLAGLVLVSDRSYRQAIALARLADDVELANRSLREEVAQRERTEVELQRHMVEIGVANESMTGRETRLIELKEEINRLCADLGRPPRYPPVWRTASAGDAPRPATAEDGSA